jgi:transcriptional regulator with XRE-family HTH domain
MGSAGAQKARNRDVAHCNVNRPRFYFHLRFVEADGQSCPVESQPERVEDFAQLIARIKDTYAVSNSDIARAIGVSPAIVSAWANRTRGIKRGPGRDTLRTLASAYPKFTEDEIFRAVGRKTPGPLSPDGEARIQELYRELTADQQSSIEIQMRALAESNRTDS